MTLRIKKKNPSSFFDFSNLEKNSSRFFGVFDPFRTVHFLLAFVQPEQGIAMPKKECSKVYGHAPRKALCVKKATKKGSGNANAKKDAGNAKASKKAAPAALAVHEPTTPTHSPPHTPSTPSNPASPTYERESWWDSFHALSRRVNDASAAIKDLKEKVKLLEEERENGAAGSVFGKRD